MPIRMTGLNSGLNTESIVAALMSAQRTKMTKVENKKTKLEWKKDIWSSLNTKIYDFYTKSLSKMRLKSNYMTKAASSSNTTKVVAKASTKAATGTYTVKVNKLASTQYVSSGKLNKVKVDDGNGNQVDADATSKTKLKDLKDTSGNPTFTNGTQIKIENGANGQTVYLDVNEETTIQDFLDKCTSVGLTATFDEKQQRLFLSSEKSGEGNAFKITSSELSSNQQQASNDLKTLVGYKGLSSADKSTVDSLLAGLQNGTVTVADATQKLQEIGKAGVESDAEKKANRFYYDVANKAAGDALSAAAAAAGQSEADYLKANGYSNLDVTDSAAVAGAKASYIDNKTTELLGTQQYKDDIAAAIQNGISSTDVQNKLPGTPSTDEFLYTFDDITTRTNNITNGIATATQNYYTEMHDNASDANASGSALASLGLTNFDGTTEIKENDAANNGTGMVVIAAKDTEVEYNGATLTSNTTNISVSGLELEILGTTEGETVNITVTNDVSGIYDTIKDFLSEYNALLKEMNSYYNADSAKGYDVLSDDEKEAMKDSEVEKWEDKIKDSLLRRDSTLNSIISSFRNKMMGTFTASNGKTYSLSSIGISTSGDYAEGGLLHIRGDEDDAEYADEKNVLKQLLEEDPDAVTDVFTHLTESLYTDLQNKMSRTPLSSALTFYNDKEMNSQLSDYKTRISKLEAKFNEMEDRYYKQFTAMEKAMANMQSQQNSLASYLGG
ncbi:MAG: flagellar filament capping protein FliD [Lachnospiraceae bacterium]